MSEEKGELMLMGHSSAVRARDISRRGPSPMGDDVCGRFPGLVASVSVGMKVPGRGQVETMGNHPDEGRHMPVPDGTITVRDP